MNVKRYKKSYGVKWVLLMALLLSFTTALAQVKVTGKVTDQNGPLPGVTVQIKTKPGTGTITNVDGEYHLTASDNDILVFRMVGYQIKELPLNGKTQLNVKLVGSESGLNEVIVTGYKNIDRRKNTSAISSITSKDIENLPAASLDVLLQGKLSGVNVQNFSGQPGVKTSLVVRGNTKISASASGFDGDNLYSNPLYVIDGVPISDDEVRAFDQTGTNFLASLNPNDVESVDILKDAAAAALYGSRAANGVVLIKTKRGKVGAPRFSFNTYQGITPRPSKVSTLIGAAERSQKLDLIYNYGNATQIRDNIPQMLTDSLNPAFNNHNDYQGLFYQTGSIHNYDISASGGSEAVNYRIGTGLYDEKGVVINTGYRRYSLNSNVGINFSKSLELLTSIRASTGKRLAGKGGGYRDVFAINPISMPSSLLQMSEQDLKSVVDPYSFQRNDNINTDISANGELRYSFLNDFRFSTRAAVNYSTQKNDYASPSTLNTDGLAYARSNYSQYTKYVFTNNLLWIKTIAKKHNVNITAVQEFESRRNEAIYLEGVGIPNDNIQVVKGVSNTNLKGSSDLSTYSKLSFLGAVHYDFENKYLLDGVWRADASSRFGKNNKWGYFPSVSVGWLASEEEFIKKISWINELKVRGSWGRAGDESSIGDEDRYNAYIAGNANYPGSSATTYGGGTAIIPNYNGITNDNISWERSEEWNIGVDAALFRGRLNFSIDAYTRNTTGQMLRITIPEYTGYTSTFTNAAGVRNSGLEFTFNGKILSEKSAFQWNPSINISFNRNKVTALPNGNRDLYYDRAVYIVGKPLNMFYGYIVDGVINSPSDLIVNPYTGAVGATKWGTLKLGYPKWRDVNGDYYISDNIGQNDVTFFGDPNPFVTGGFTNYFSYKGFSVQILTTFTFGRDIINNTLAQRLSNGLFYGNPKDFAKASITDISKYNYWRQPGDNATLPALNPFMGLYAWRSGQSIFKEPGWYVRIKNINLGYRFNAQNNKWMQRAKITSLRLYSTIDNVHMFQKFTGIDAERVDGQGYDYGDGYPLPTKYTFGLQIEF
ncbi:SusC/RagA family TonB-linked outer membrane protein [Mucilaginibacter sp. SG564]|uniref:SusC/RagA family TonB-linked outer membrane protein n=1 Tax=unclassified Mucilaginibacter TaxID=2617802 RepID=UPI001555A70C|nr:SusC/RagA family TonB-linked outer membrane protein [Mucilaginibacter sp. SG564]NOW97175.1 TonB-linked SusC/RagA family outer membrane protein [Mucilaginibacter sp. SG564]